LKRHYAGNKCCYPARPPRQGREAISYLEKEKILPEKAKVTTDHAEIRRWTEARGGWPATVKATEGNGKAGVLTIDYPGFNGENTLERITWEEFFESFERNTLALLYQAEPESRFSNLLIEHPRTNPAQRRANFPAPQSETQLPREHGPCRLALAQVWAKLSTLWQARTIANEKT
jgi:hypothetical protein